MGNDPRNFQLCGKCGFKHYDDDPCPAAPSSVVRADPVVEAVRQDLHDRSQVGLKKYGTTLAENPAGLRDRLQHAYEEALDLANYLKWSIRLLDTPAENQSEEAMRYFMMGKHEPGPEFSAAFDEAQKAAVGLKMICHPRRQSWFSGCPYCNARPEMECKMEPQEHGNVLDTSPHRPL